MRVTKRLDLDLLAKELAAASVAVQGIGAYPIEGGAATTLHTYDATGAEAEMPAGAQAVVDAHVAPPLIVQFVERIQVTAIKRTTDATPTEAFRFTTRTTHVYRATFQIIAIDAGNGVVKDQEARVTFKRGTAASPVQVGATAALYGAQDAGAAAWAIQPSISGADVVISVLGAAGRTIDWSLAGEIIAYAPGGLP